ncbi:transposase [Pontiella sp.]|uniref:transposase n=1 Tax=Pontiella sp. TaxID=2837462 RepID=UPI0035691E0C
MPRSIRHEYPGAVYHAMCRGNNGQSIFKEDKGRRLFLATLEEVCEQTGWMVHAYVLMSNHYHLLLETPEANLVTGMKWFQGAYTQRFNAMFQCRGHLFQGRYKALPIEAGQDSSYFQAVGNYIHLNPFRAGMAGSGLDRPLEHYTWSSYPAYVSRVKRVPAWLNRVRLLNACGLDGEASGGWMQYRDFLEFQMSGSQEPFDEMVAKQLKRGWYVGGESFRGWLSKKLPDHSDNLRGDQRRAHDEAEAERLLDRALVVLGVSESALVGMKSNRPEKQAVAWLLKKSTTVTGVWIADRLKMGSRANLSRALSALNNEIDSERKELKQKMTQCAG